jgi:hypothetical protein
LGILAGHYLPITYAIYGAAAILALLFVRETRNVKLEDLDGAPPGNLPARPAKTVIKGICKGVAWRRVQGGGFSLGQ